MLGRARSPYIKFTTPAQVTSSLKPCLISTAERFCNDHFGRSNCLLLCWKAFTPNQNMLAQGDVHCRKLWGSSDIHWQCCTVQHFRSQKCNLIGSAVVLNVCNFRVQHKFVACQFVPFPPCCQNCEGHVVDTLCKRVPSATYKRVISFLAVREIIGDGKCGSALYSYIVRVPRRMNSQ